MRTGVSMAARAWKKTVLETGQNGIGGRGVATTG